MCAVPSPTRITRASDARRFACPPLFSGLRVARWVGRRAPVDPAPLPHLSGAKHLSSRSPQICQEFTKQTLDLRNLYKQNNIRPREADPTEMDETSEIEDLVLL